MRRIDLPTYRPAVRRQEGEQGEGQEERNRKLEASENGENKNPSQGSLCNCIAMKDAACTAAVGREKGEKDS